MSPGFKNFSDKNYSSSLGNISQSFTTFAKKFNLSSQFTFSKPQIFFLSFFTSHTRSFPFSSHKQFQLKQFASKDTFESDHWKICCILQLELNIFPLWNRNIILKTLNDKMIHVLLALIPHCTCAYARGETGPGSHCCHMYVYNAHYSIAVTV